MSISIGMVGIGMFGRHFIKLFRGHPDVHRIALCDLRSDRLAECSEKFEIEETYPRCASLMALAKLLITDDNSKRMADLFD